MSTPQPPGIPDPPPSAPEPAVPAPEPAPPEDRSSSFQPGLYLKIGLALFAFGYAAAFVIENTKSVSVHFVFWTANVRLIWVILLLLVIGLVCGMLLSQLHRHRRRVRLAKKAAKSGDARPDVGH